MGILQLLSLLMVMLATALSGAEGRLVEQSSPYLMGRLGASESMTCTLKDTTYPWMSWYLQDAQGQMHFLESLRYKGDTGNTSRMGTSYQTERVTDTVLRLAMKNVTQSQIIYCTCSYRDRRSGSIVYFGEGTRLTVLEDLSKISDPEVAIFPPSKQEIKEKRKATLVCLATNFYPDHIKLVWQVNGVERKEGVRTEESLLDNYKEKYSLTSRLRISHQEWSNPKNTFQCFVEFYGNETKPYNKVINGVADCSVSEESYLRSAMASKSVYVLLIFKSALYGVFVMGLMLRNKQVQ